MHRIYVFLIAIVLLATSCTGPKRSVYFRENTPLDPTVTTQKMDRFKEAIIQPDDILAINVTSPSSLVEDKGNTTVAIFNGGGTPFATTATLGGASTNANGYLVDASGLIDYPFLGKTKVGGLTIRQAKDAISGKLRSIVKEPVVEIRIVNYRITILGEVNRPGTIMAPNHKISIIDAIAAAGDIPITGRKDNITIIRENEGVREFAHINLNSKEAFNSPYFYLKQNDVIYVEPARSRKQEGSDFFRFYLPAISSLMSTLLAVYGIIQLTTK
ncbi:MAG: polysaccharide biosynthesis/export family protein [Bacteroidetes bacterium]|nr:polysaccharide biosynthesis/export family protein [Bacteroidota bacterium]MBS1739823.1 polysaccharide biosynthesis/export family protein [Bacteroidota bacterium]